MSKYLTETYQKSIRKAYNPIDKNTERVLVIRAQNGCMKSQNKLVEAQLYQIINIANKYINTNPNNDIHDLIGTAVAGSPNKNGEFCNGYIRAIQTFDVTRGDRLITWAKNFIRNAIRDYSMDNDLVRGSRQTGKSRANDETHMSDLEYEANMRNMTVTEYVRHMKDRGYDIDVRAKAKKHHAISFDTPIQEDSTQTTLLDITADANACTDSGLVRTDIKRMLEILDKDELELISCFYGIDRDKMTLDEIGQDKGGISRQAVSKNLEKVMTKLQRRWNYQE